MAAPLVRRVLLAQGGAGVVFAALAYGLMSGDGRVALSALAGAAVGVASNAWFLGRTFRGGEASDPAAESVRVVRAGVVRATLAVSLFAVLFAAARTAAWDLNALVAVAAFGICHLTGSLAALGSAARGAGH